MGQVYQARDTRLRASSGASSMSAILRDQPPPMHDTQPATPPALARLVRRALEKAPEDRWQSARDLEPELTWIAAGRSARVEWRGRA